MQNIFSHIAYLLIEHECVIIPGFGALIHTSAPSKDADENVFSPPCVSLGFNSDLKHNDGILADSIKREQKISYNEANKMVSDFSAKLIESLKSKKKVTIPQVGNFTLSEDNKTNFFPAADLSANAGQYGFKNFYLPLLNEIAAPAIKEKDVENSGKRVIMIPLSRRLLTAASVAAIALLFLLFSTPIDNREIPTQYAGMFLPAQAKTNEDTVGAVLVVKEDEEFKEIKEIKEVVTEIEAAPVETMAELVVNPENGYLIIIASYPNRSEAERFLPQFKKEFNSASIIEKSNRSRIFIRSFDDKVEAEYFLYKFKIDNPKRKDAWLLCNKTKG